jgi:hypothetical protein
VKTLTDAEIQQLSFMHYYLAIENELDSQRFHYAEWSIESEAQRIDIAVPGAALMQDPMVFLCSGTISISAWQHFEVFRVFPEIGWATETRKPPNPISSIHYLFYKPRSIFKITGYGRDPAARYLYIFDSPVVTAEFNEIEDQQHLRQQHHANFERRRQLLQNDPQEAAMRVPLDEEDRLFLKEIVDKSQKHSGKD